jgi:3-oxoacyl-[acyl-carrier-protein] synthase II
MRSTGNFQHRERPTTNGHFGGKDYIMLPESKQRVVITGLGVLSPVGIGKEDYWKALLQGKSGIGPVTRFDTSSFDSKIAGELKDFAPEQFLDRKEIRRMDRFAQFGVAAAKLAVADAALEIDKENLEDIGVVMGSGIGGIETLCDQHNILLTKGPSRISPLFIPMIISNMAAGQIAISLGPKGPNITVVTACASGTNAIGEAYLMLRRGAAEVILAGGTEAPIVPVAMAGFCSMKAMSTNNDEPQRASRPFDRNRDGFVISEGAGVMVLETLGHASARGARIYGEVAGYGCTADGYHITAPEPEGAEAARAIRIALEDAGISPDQVDYINAHGTSTGLNDKIETMAIKKVLGDHAYRTPVSSIKSMIGHSLGAAGALEAIACALSISTGWVPPTINYEQPDLECDLDYVPNQARQCPVRVAVSNSFGFGGHNGVLVLKKFEG